mmetsp:Transcript_53379/g.103263  ORF Transcript_53379/g.103263 Transcript_53379/m.103263 type:complete len:319 (-) Transcript_53379:764-1720(-)
MASQLMAQHRTTGHAAQVVRQTTPLSYRVKENADGDEGGKETTIPKPGLRRPSPSPIVMSRNLDRERHGGTFENHPEHECHDGERYEGTESARTLPPIHDQTGFSRTCLHEDNRPPVEPAARSQSPPRSQGTPQSLMGLRGLERERPGAAEAVGGVLASVRTTRLASPALSPGRACRVTTRTHSRSPTPQGTPIALFRHTGKSTPVTIWHGLDKERQPGNSVEVPAFNVTSTAVTVKPTAVTAWPPHGVLSPRAPVIGLDPVPVVAPPPPMVVTRSPTRSLEPRDRSEAFLGGASTSTSTRGSSMQLQQAQQQQQQQQ